MKLGTVKYAMLEVGQRESNASKQRRRKRIVSETFFDVPVDLDWDRFYLRLDRVCGTIRH